MNDYEKRVYGMAVIDGADTLIVSKSTGDWLFLQMKTNGRGNGAITLRSKESAEMLHFMLSQVLGKQ